MAEMSEEEIARFVLQGTFTGKLATVRKDVWLVMLVIQVICILTPLVQK